MEKDELRPNVSSIVAKKSFFALTKRRRGDLLPAILPLEHQPNVWDTCEETCTRKAVESRALSCKRPIYVLPVLFSFKPTCIDNIIPGAGVKVLLKYVTEKVKL